jgi:hypothetical protein
VGLEALARRSPGPPSGPCPPLFGIVLVSCWERRDSLGEEREDGERIGVTTEEFVGTEGDTGALHDAPSRLEGHGNLNKAPALEQDPHSP